MSEPSWMEDARDHIDELIRQLGCRRMDVKNLILERDDIKAERDTLKAEVKSLEALVDTERHWVNLLKDVTDLKDESNMLQSSLSLAQENFSKVREERDDLAAKEHSFYHLNCSQEVGRIIEHDKDCLYPGEEYTPFGSANRIMQLQARIARAKAVPWGKGPFAGDYNKGIAAVLAVLKVEESEGE